MVYGYKSERNTVFDYERWDVRCVFKFWVRVRVIFRPGIEHTLLLLTKLFFPYGKGNNGYWPLWSWPYRDGFRTLARTGSDLHLFYERNVPVYVYVSWAKVDIFYVYLFYEKKRHFTRMSPDQKLTYFTFIYFTKKNTSLRICQLTKCSLILRWFILPPFFSVYILSKL